MANTSVPQPGVVVKLIYSILTTLLSIVILMVIEFIDCLIASYQLTLPDSHRS